MEKNMSANTLPTTEILSNFEECNVSLAFIESALRGLLLTGSFNEADVGNGLSLTLQTLISEYKKVYADLQNYLPSVRSSTIDLANFYGENKQT
jgi:hypothetical protein